MFKLINEKVRFMPNTLEDLLACGCPAYKNSPYDSWYTHFEKHVTKKHIVNNYVRCPRCEEKMVYTDFYWVGICNQCKVMIDIGPDYLFIYDQKKE